jgi:DNA polymerase-1
VLARRCARHAAAVLRARSGQGRRARPRSRAARVAPSGTAETISFEDLCGKGVKPDRLQPGRGRSGRRIRRRGFRPLPAPARAPVSRKSTADARACTRIYSEIEIPTREVLFRMERNGILINADLLAQQSNELGKRLLELEALAHEAAGQPFNVNSPKQLAEILFTKLGLPVKKKTPSGTPSTDEEVLSELALDYPLPKLLLESRGLAKLKGTYCSQRRRQSARPFRNRKSPASAPGLGSCSAGSRPAASQAIQPDRHRQPE